MTTPTKTKLCLGSLALLAAVFFAGWMLRPVGDSLRTIPVPPPEASNPDWRPFIPKWPKDVQRADDEWFGYTPNQQQTAAFLATLDEPTFRGAAPDLLRANVQADEPVLLYRYLDKAYSDYSGGQKWVVGSQGIGDCVSWGWAHGVDIVLAIAYVNGESGEWKPAATESIYGGSRVEARGVNRGGYSDGSYGGAAAKWVRDWGVLWRQDYPDLGFDLSTYSSRRAKDWGNYGSGGQDNGNGKADEVAREHPVKTVALVTTFEEAAAAIANGYPVPVCSGQGFSSRRDDQGFCRASGSWSHCMCFIGVRYDRPGLLCLNSWGPNWVTGPKYPSDMPDGSFWVDAAVATRMLRGRDSFAVSNLVGFPRRKLDHFEGWGNVVTRPSRFVVQNPKEETEQWNLNLAL